MHRRSPFVSVVPFAILFAISTTLAQSSPEQRAQGLVDKGLEFLKTQQKPDGSWQGDRDPPGLTALVLRAFLGDAKFSADTDFIKKGFDKLLSYQTEDGGIYKDAQTNYNTAIAISALTAAKNPRFKTNIDKAVAYLKGLQWSDINESADGSFKGEKDPWYGGWGYSGRTKSRGRPDLSNTQMALEAMHDAGLKPDDPAYQAAIKFVSRQQNSSETNDQSWSGNDGGFIYGPGDDRKGSSMAGEHRSYGSMTYAGLKSFIYAGLTKDDPRIRAAWDWITKNWSMDENPGLRAGNPDNAKQGLYYYYHTLSRALGEYDSPVLTDAQGNKHDWRVELIDKLAALQKPDGSWAGEQRWMEGNPILVTAYSVMALQEAIADLKQHPVSQ